MSDSVMFWLLNRNCAGTKAAVIADQVLVLYRDRYYVVMDGAAQTRGGKPLRFSSSSLPSVWKRALKGDLQSPVTSQSGMDSVTKAHLPRRERKQKEKSAMSDPEKELTPEKNGNTPRETHRSPRKSETKPAIQPPVAVNCPYCNSRHDIPVDRGKNGKPFFMPCGKCKKEFAVRFVPVTMYQAQVAGFR